MKKIVRLTESDLVKIVKKVINEGLPSAQQTTYPTPNSRPIMAPNQKLENPHGRFGGQRKLVFVSTQFRNKEGSIWIKPNGKVFFSIKGSGEFYEMV